MATDSVIKKVVRDVVNEAFDQRLGTFKQEIIYAVQEENQKLRSDVAVMRDEIITSNDEVAGEIKTMREEQEMLNARSAKINNIEDRVDKLEEIHPGNQHTAF